jgi:mono/diheme cytochrome c family protein
MRLLAVLSWLFTAAIASTTASAQEGIGDPVAGFSVAAELCSFCHAILPEEPESPLPQATRFQTIADTPGMTERALVVWLTTSHPFRTMPHLILEPEDLRNVVAYIHSLGHRQ